jgi:hypothetical protein
LKVVRRKKLVPMLRFFCSSQGKYEHAAKQDKSVVSAQRKLIKRAQAEGRGIPLPGRMPDLLATPPGAGYRCHNGAKSAASGDRAYRIALKICQI